MKIKVCQVKKIKIFFAVLFLGLFASPAWAEEGAQPHFPAYMGDRGTGVTTSLFGTYVRKGEWLIYPFYEYEKFSVSEYTAKELGFTPLAGDKDSEGKEKDHRGKEEVQEALLFFAYGITEDIAVEFETAFYETKTLTMDPNDTTSGFKGNVPGRTTTDQQFKESGFGATQAELRWRFARETETTWEKFVAFEVEFPLQKNKKLIGAQDWEIVTAFGWVKGFPWGTITPRFSIEYDGEEIGVCECALEYLKRVSDSWRVVTTLEGDLDELSLIGELQYFISPHALLKLNTGLGLTETAPDFAPEVGVVFTF
jgi:hypothetical protein